MGRTCRRRWPDELGRGVKGKRGHFIAVLDVGGTTLRSATFNSATGVLGAVHRTPTAGTTGADDGTGQRRVVQQIVDTVAALVDVGADTAVVAFAGPVTAGGVVLAAPTVAGKRWNPMDLQAHLTQQSGIAVTVLNELTAAAWRYRQTEQRPFCVITVSSGIGNKVVWGDQVLLDPAGHGGEIGHWQVDRNPEAPLCECGGRGHLSAIASGRGTQARARTEAMRNPEGFAHSSLATTNNPDNITTHDLVRAARTGDEFATQIVQGGITALAAAITMMFTAIGVRRFLLIGGFAQALGPRYLELLRQSLKDAGCFGLSEREIDTLVELGAPDDDHSLIGAGLWALDHFSGRPNGDVTP
ncbi:MAG: ROK family protein [Nakamurella sp.]